MIYVMLCYVMLCFVMLCCVMICCCILVCYVMLCVIRPFGAKIVTRMVHGLHKSAIEDAWVIKAFCFVGIPLKHNIVLQPSYIDVCD